MHSSILITEESNYSQQALEIYENIGQIYYGYENSLTLKEKERNAIFCIVVRLNYFLDKNYLKNFPYLRYIISPTTGINHIDVDYCTKNQIEIISLKGHAQFLDSIPSTAEHTLGLILNLLRNTTGAHIEMTIKEAWNRDKFIGRNFNGLTLGILGLGRVGLQVSRLANAFGAVVIAHDPYVPDDKFKFNKVKKCSFEEVLKRSDILSIHVDLRDENINLIGPAQFKLMKRHSYIVNTSRGEIIDELAIIDSLKSGQLKGAAIDVISDELSKGEKYKTLIDFAKNNLCLLLTPHLGGATQESMLLTEMYLAQYFSKKRKKTLHLETTHL